MSDKGETCKSLAEQLGEPYTAMRVGKLKRACCEPEDLDGKYILPTGVLKITASIKKEMDIIETAKPEVVWVKVTHHKTANTRRVFAEDLETKRKVSVIVPANRKKGVDHKGKKLQVERGLQDGKYLYRYPVRKS